MNDDIEIRARFTDSRRDHGNLVKTVVAMANSAGGRIVLQAPEGDAGALDTQRLSAAVNACVAPPITDLTVSASAEGALEIRVPASTIQPHVFVSELDYTAKGRTRGLFYPGQVWVRRHSRNEPADAADIERMLRARAARMLAALSTALTASASPTTSESDAALLGPALAAGTAGVDLTPAAALAVRVTTDPDAAPVNIDINRSYPFTTGALGEALGEGVNWAAAAVRALGLKGDPRYHYAVRNADGRIIVHKYSEAALQRLRDQLAAVHDWNPWSA